MFLSASDTTGNYEVNDGFIESMDFAIEVEDGQDNFIS